LEMELANQLNSLTNVWLLFGTIPRCKWKFDFGAA
jgi:hypothetical protein